MVTISVWYETLAIGVLFGFLAGTIIAWIWKGRKR